jgi:transposase InsO family protein
MLKSDGVDVSAASVKRALARRGLLLPVRYQAERRQLAKARRAVFVAPPSRRNRIWQTDFSEFETIAGGTWQISGYVDYVAKVCLSCEPSGTKTAVEAVSSLEAAIAAAEGFLRRPLADDCLDPVTGEVAPLVIVTDNGSAYRSSLFERFITARPFLTHVRTRYRSPQTNGVVERFFETLKYEHLYREEIQSGVQLADEIVASGAFTTPSGPMRRSPSAALSTSTSPSQRTAPPVEGAAESWEAARQARNPRYDLFQAANVQES